MGRKESVIHMFLKGIFVELLRRNMEILGVRLLVWSQGEFAIAIFD